MRGGIEDEIKTCITGALEDAFERGRIAERKAVAARFDALARMFAKSGLHVQASRARGVADCVRTMGEEHEDGPCARFESIYDCEPMASATCCRDCGQPESAHKQPSTAGEVAA